MEIGLVDPIDCRKRITVVEKEKHDNRFWKLAMLPN